MQVKSSMLLLPFFHLPFLTTGQTIEKDKETGLYATSGVIQVDSLAKDALYSKALEWISLNYKSAKDVIQYSSKEEGKIICKGNFMTSMFLKEGWIEHTMTLEFKDNRFRYTFTNFSYYSSGSGRVAFEGAMMSKKKIIATTEEKIKNNLDDLTAYFKKASSGKSDKW